MALVLRRGSKGAAVKELQKLLKLVPDGVFGSITEEAVKSFQEANGLKGDGIVGPATMTKLLMNRSTLKKSRRKINKIIVHCTATEEGADYTVYDVRKWHLGRGYSDIGYHYLIYRDGSIHNGRDVDLIGAHCKGYNSNSIGVCYVGGLDKKGDPKDTRTEAQKESLLKLLTELKSLYPDAKIHSHKDFANKACPSFDATKEYKNI